MVLLETLDRVGLPVDLDLTVPKVAEDPRVLLVLLVISGQLEALDFL